MGTKVNSLTPVKKQCNKFYLHARMHHHLLGFPNKQSSHTYITLYSRVTVAGPIKIQDHQGHHPHPSILLSFQVF